MGDASAILEGLQVLRRSEYVDAYHMAILCAATGHGAHATAELERAVAENSAFLYMWSVDPRLDPLRDEPCVQEVVSIGGEALSGF